MVAVISLTIGYAALPKRVKIEGGAEYRADMLFLDFEIDPNQIEVTKFNNGEVLSGDGNNQSITFDTENLILSGLTALLPNPGAKVTFDIPIRNVGNLAARIADIEFGTEKDGKIVKSFSCTSLEGLTEEATDFCNNVRISVDYKKSNGVVDKIITSSNGAINYITPGLSSTYTNRYIVNSDNTRSEVISSTQLYFLGGVEVVQNNNGKVEKQIVGNSKIFNPGETDSISISYEYVYKSGEEQTSYQSDIKVDDLSLKLVLYQSNSEWDITQTVERTVPRTVSGE